MLVRAEKERAREGESCIHLAKMYKKLQLLRSITNSHANSKSSIILDASKYIKELKRKVESLEQDLATERISTDNNPLASVRVHEEDKGFVINVNSERDCSGVLVFILEAFEELGLNVLHARVSCSDSFHFEAVAKRENQGEGEQIDAQVVEQRVLQAIQTWNGHGERE